MFALCFTSAAATDLRLAEVRKTTRKQTNPAMKAARVGLAALAIVLAAASPSFAGKNGNNGGGNGGSRSGGSSFRMQSNGSNGNQSIKKFNQSTTPTFTQSNPTFTKKFTPGGNAQKLNGQTFSGGSNGSTPRFTTPKKYTQQAPINLGIKTTDIKRGNVFNSTLDKKIGIPGVVKQTSPVLTLPGNRKIADAVNGKPFIKKVDPIFGNNGNHQHHGNGNGNGKHNDCHNNNGKKNCHNWDWCWKQHCKPCYKPCHQNWQCYTYPKWCGLHRHTCGYYVNVPVIVVQGVDLQLLAIRAVDSGDPSQNLGPRFRVWIRNNTPTPTLRPFNLLVLAGRDVIPAADLPQAGVRIEAMQPGQILPVDVRLPVQANDANLATIHVLVDSHREIPEVFEDNNGIVLPRGEVISVDPALLATDVQTAVPGAEINVAGEGLGVAAGQVIVKFAGLDLAAEVTGWSELGLQIRLPALQIASPVDAQIIAIRADGKQINPLPLKVVPGQVQISAQPTTVQPVSAVTTTIEDGGAVQAMFGN